MSRVKGEDVYGALNGITKGLDTDPNLLRDLFKGLSEDDRIKYRSRANSFFHS
jgi:hypothetical protein